ncbi:MAG: hypothetical protein AAFO94_05035 [Bacteroidota bacterium]
MKNRIAFGLLTLVTTLMSFTTLSATRQMEGYWSNRGENVEIEVRSTSYGIKVKRTDRNRWFYYDREGNSSYSDSDGNRYYLDGSGLLVWKNRSGRRQLRFRRMDDGRRNSRNYDQRRDYHGYDDDWRNDRSGRYNNRYNDRYDDDWNRQRYNQWNRKLKVKYLEGNWYNRRSGSSIFVEKRNRTSFRINTQKGWTTFRQTAPATFVDRRGNTIQVLNNGRLKYTRVDRRGARTMVFSRSGTFRR